MKISVMLFLFTMSVANAQSQTTDPNAAAITAQIAKNPDWNNYWLSQKNDLRAATRRQEMEQAIPGMARYYMSQYNMSPGDAVDALIKDTVGHAYITVPTENGQQISFPTKIVPSTADASSVLSKANLGLAPALDKLGTTDIAGRGDSALLTRQAVQNGYWAFDDETGSMVRMYDSANDSKVVIFGNGAPLMLDVQKVKDSQIKNGSLNVDPSTLLVDVGTPGHPAFLDNTEFEYLNFEPVYSETSVTFYIAELVGVKTSHQAPSVLSKSDIACVLAALIKADEWATIAAKNNLTVGKREMYRLPTADGKLVIVAFHSLNGKSQISITLGFTDDPSLIALNGQTLYFYQESIPLLKARFESAISAIDTFVKQRATDEEASKRETAKADALLK